MGQSVSKVFKMNGVLTVDGSSRLSLSSRGALRQGAVGQCATANDLSSKCTADTEESQPCLAAIQSANAFFGSHHSFPPRATLYRGKHRSDDSQLEDSVARRQQHPLVDVVHVVVENRTPSRPVPVKAGVRKQYSSSSYEGNFDLWHENDESDELYLKRLYEMRTWDMYVRITQARKQQRFGGPRGDVSAVLGAPMMEAEPQLIESPGTSIDVASDHEMIFPCDFE